MATTVGKILGQSAPSATTNTDVYTVPGSTEANFNIYACNRGAATDTFRVALRPNGDALANQHYIAYDVIIAPQDAVTFSGLVADAADVVTVYASSANLSFTVTGLETS